MKKYILLLLFVVAGNGYSQSVNDYKAVIVPVKFDFLKKENQYRLTTLSKFNLKKAGFEAFYSNETTPMGFGERCDLLYFDLQNEGGFLITKLFITLKDCNGKIVFQSATGRSKEKDYEAAYTECFNEAFESVQALNYKYDGTKTESNIGMKSIKEEVVEVREVVVEKVAVPVKEINSETSVKFLYAQPVANGYQLVDTTPKVVMKVFKTSNPSCYIAVKGDNQGVLIAKGADWFFQYYKNENLISEKIEVKF
ncbi:hypothetical protein [uncultured Flavobacterium sp.]|uniref:hypothetical protein n=1 Tax=uncultured Flavobacterium sp. TaxID=165435 RepID=UPI0030EECE82|tara:strand:+ start:340 stop:1098 length:759 start_codon:yes stop_codon:yes gene_type:complete